MVFHDYHSAASVCTPARAGLLTGRYETVPTSAFFTATARTPRVLSALRVIPAFGSFDTQMRPPTTITALF